MTIGVMSIVAAIVIEAKSMIEGQRDQDRDPGQRGQDRDPDQRQVLVLQLHLDQTMRIAVMIGFAHVANATLRNVPSAIGAAPRAPLPRRASTM